jgi:transposase-like protein
MTTISFARHQFPPAIIRHAVWLYARFTLSYRDVEELLAERGLDVSYETVRRWVLKFGPLFARKLRRRRSRPTSRWHLDEMAVMISGKQFWLWRAVDSEGEGQTPEAIGVRFGCAASTARGLEFAKVSPGLMRPSARTR